MASANYKRFLAAPSSAQLTPDAKLLYVTTTTVVTGAAEIIKHLAKVRHQMKKKKENVLDEVNGPDASVFEIETVIEFVSSGGPYLPGLDDNFLADQVATFPVLHTVHFDAEGRIKQIRLLWDQGSLLKQIEVIGKTGRNWPIRDGSDMIKFINNSSKSTGEATGASSNSQSQNTRALRDPHASLDLFAPREEQERVPAAVSPYAGTRRPQRSLADILGNDDGDDEAREGQGRDDPSQPAYGAATPKAGFGKLFQPSRLFEGQEYREEDDVLESPTKRTPHYKPNPRKYQHFDLTDEPEPVGATQKALPTRPGVNQKKSDFWTELENAQDEDDGDFQHYRKPEKTNARRTENDDQDPLGVMTNQTKTAQAGSKNDLEYDPYGNNQRIRIAGDGMGGPKNRQTDSFENRGIAIAGDGMGSKKGTRRDFLTDYA